MADVFVTLQRVGESTGSGDVPGWLSTHPRPENREARIADAITAMNRDFSARPVRRDEYLRRLEGLVFGEDPRQGFFTGQVFHHPDMKFALDFPAGWKTANTRQAVGAISEPRDAVVRLTLAAESTAAQAVEKFLAQSGVRHHGTRSRVIDGLPAQRAGFTAQLEQGTLLGEIVCVEYDGRVFKMLGYTPQARWSAYVSEIERSLASFRRLTDPRFLDVQPKRVALVSPDRTMDAAELARRYDASVPPETLALINGLDPAGRFEPGRTYKVVRGGRLPTQATE